VRKFPYHAYQHHLTPLLGYLSHFKTEECPVSSN
jgi:hypothetical protein